MDSDIKYRNRILQLYKESYDENMTTQSIIEKETGYVVSDKYVKIIAQWMKACFRKKNSRNAIPFALKKELFVKQNGRCVICGCELGDDWSKLHTDHIVPSTKKRIDANMRQFFLRFVVKLYIILLITFTWDTSKQTEEV